MTVQTALKTIWGEIVNLPKTLMDVRIAINAEKIVKQARDEYTRLINAEMRRTGQTYEQVEDAFHLDWTVRNGRLPDVRFDAWESEVQKPNYGWHAVKLNHFNEFLAHRKNGTDIKVADDRLKTYQDFCKQCPSAKMFFTHYNLGGDNFHPHLRFEGYYNQLCRIAMKRGVSVVDLGKDIESMAAVMHHWDKSDTSIALAYKNDDVGMLEYNWAHLLLKLLEDGYDPPKSVTEITALKKAIAQDRGIPDRDAYDIEIGEGEIRRFKRDPDGPIQYHNGMSYPSYPTYSHR